MSDPTRHGQPDYLWDGSGPADPEIARLESILRPLGHTGTLPPLPRRPAGPASRAWQRRWLAVAAAVAILAGGAWFTLALRSGTWRVSTLAGLPAVDGRAVTTRTRMALGQWLVTDGGSRARIAVGSIGSVEVEPNTRLQLVANSRVHRMELDRGTIHARIWAPPKLFVVNMQAATAIDLGCAYTLQMSDSGEGMLRVTSGWVGLERDQRTTYIPEGAVSRIRTDRGPGTPWYEDAPSGYGEALLILDFGGDGDPRRTQALERVLATTRRRDALTLWHLLTRGTAAERERVYDRLAAIVPPPQGVTRQLVLGGDQHALDAWWNAIGIETSTWWRLLKKKW